MPTETTKELIARNMELEAENNHLFSLVDDILMHKKLRKALMELGGEPIVQKMQYARDFKSILPSLKNNLP